MVRQAIYINKNLKCRGIVLTSTGRRWWNWGRLSVILKLNKKPDVMGQLCAKIILEMAPSHPTTFIKPPFVGLCRTNFYN